MTISDSTAIARARQAATFGAAALLAAFVLTAGASHAAEPAIEKSPEQGKNTVRQQSFGKSPDGTEETLFICTNRNGCELKLTTYGARLVSLTVPDRDGNLADVALGFEELASYVAHKAYFGCTTGRFANRIAGGHFRLAGKPYQLAVNNGPNHLHGGLSGFDRKHWRAKPIESPDVVGVEFTYDSPNGDQGYPGGLSVRVVYTWSNDNSLSINYTAVADEMTILNLTNHGYWNLGGVAAGKPVNGSILDEQLMIAADKYLPADDTSIPSGELAAVKGTAMDFTTPRRIGERIDALKRPPYTTKGYDLCFVLRDSPPPGQGGRAEPSLAARVNDPKTGRIMEVLTTEPGIQLYTGNFLEGDTASGGFNQHDALCLETQHYPDSPNHPDFPTTVLKPGETYRQTTVHKFSAK